MNFSKHSISQYILYDTKVENIFISEYMLKAPENCVKAYLLGLMYAEMGQPADDDTLAKSLGLSPSELQNCWRYWEDEGLVSRRMGENGMELEFISLREQAFGTPAASEKEEQKGFSLGDKEASKLYADIEQLTGELLQPSAIEDICVWVQSYGMTPGFILEGYKYSISRKRSTNSRYVGKILKDWKAKGLTDSDSVEAYLAENDRRQVYYGKIFRQLGFMNHPTVAQKSLMDKWQDEMGFSLDRILEACDKTVGSSHPNLNYVDSVLKNWYKEQKEAEHPSDASLADRVEQLYAKDREENEKKTADLRRRVFTEVPRIPEIMDELKDAGYKLSRAVFASGARAADEQRRRIAALNEEKSRLLRESGFAESATDRIYTCSLCKDTGELEDGSRCSCYAQKLAMARSGFAK